jgi:hypothetical protein
MGCSISSPATLALSMVDHPDHLPEIDHDWSHMAIYYAQSTGGRGIVRTVPGFRDVLVRSQYSPADMRDLAERLRRLGECLFAAGAIALYPGIAGLRLCARRTTSIAFRRSSPGAPPRPPRSTSTCWLWMRAGREPTTWGRTGSGPCAKISRT